MRRLGAAVLWAAGSAVLLAAASLAQPRTLPDDDLEALQAYELLQDSDLADLSGEVTSPAAWASAAIAALSQEKYVRARELAEQLLEHDPDSFEGHYLVGVVHHRGEGNLPRSLFHLRRARTLFEGLHTSIPPSDAPWIWHALILSETAMVAGEMGRHEHKLELLAERDDLYSPASPAERGWPLMRLRRYDEARAAVAEAMATGDPEEQAAALTALCAIEAEQQLREVGLQACLAAADHEREHRLGGPTTFTNAAEASLGMLRLAEAETLLVEATGKFVRGTVSNPWLDLTQLYLAQGRTAEALEAVRLMQQWRRRQPVAIDEQNRAETETTSALFLLIAGRADDAARITRRILARPDRTGFTSSESEQMEAGAALLDSVAHRLAAERLAERIAASPVLEGLRLRLDEASLRLRSWSSARRAASLLAAERMLLATLRPYLAGAVELPEWIEPELVAILGDGVVDAALDRARAAETLEPAGAYFGAWSTEVERLSGRHERALEHADRALAELPAAEVLLRARVAALAADSARDLGRSRRAAELYDLVLQSDPGTLRRLGLSLPARLDAEPTPVARAAAGALRGSPRFEIRDAAPFVLQVQGLPSSADACLLGPSGTRFACAQVTVRAGEDDDALGRRLALELQDAAFAPKLDLTQSDLDSLDGSPTAAGGRGRERIRSVLDELTEPADR